MPGQLFPTFWESLWITLRALWRVTRQVFHEAVGTIFALFALYGGIAAWRQWRNKPVLWLVGFAVLYALMMGMFAFTAFGRAKRVR